MDSNSFILAMRNLIALMLFIQIAVAATSSSEANITLDGCESKCGNLDVPYPFGTSYGCHRQGGFKVKCDHAYIPHKLFLEGDDMDLEVLEISIQNRMVRARATVWPFAAGNISDMVVKVVPANLQPYVLSTDRNSIVIVGCGFQASVRTMMSSLQGETVFASCAPSCTQQKHQPNRCEDDGCCELAIPTGLTSFTVQFSWLDQNAHVQMSCTVAETRPEFGCISKNSECLDSTSSAYGYVCQCKDGYNGNPYVTDGCHGSGTGIRLAAGVFLAIGISIGLFLLLLALAAIFANKRLKIRKSIFPWQWVLRAINMKVGIKCPV